jgi:hypothetical protein
MEDACAHQTAPGTKSEPASPVRGYEVEPERTKIVSAEPGDGSRLAGPAY